MFRKNKKDEEMFRTYYERKRNRKCSLWHCIRELAPFVIFMQLGAFGPPTLVFLYSRELGPWWWILLIIYELIVVFLTYLIYRYREIVELRGYFTEEEFRIKFSRELWLVRIMDKCRKILFN